MIRTIKFINENFLALSAAASAFGAAAAIIFITGYLVAFDSSLIWVIESTDIFKFVIIAASLLAASIAFIGGLSDYIKLMQLKGKLKLVIIAVIFVFIVVFYGFLAYEQYKSGNKTPFISELFNMLLALSILILVSMSVDYWVQIRDENRTTQNQNFAVGIFVIISIYLLGVSYAFKVKSDTRNLKEIIIKDKSNIESVFKKTKIVIFLSHHVIFESDKKIYVVPSTDIVRISSDSEI